MQNKLFKPAAEWHTLDADPLALWHVSLSAWATMSVTEPMLNIYPTNHHAQLHHDGPLANGETSSTTSSESDVQLASVKGQNGSLSPMDNGPDMYTSDGSLDSQGQVPQYVNGPLPNSCPPEYIQEYDATMDGTNANYVPIPGPEYDGHMDYPSPGQEYVNPELYQTQGSEYVDYNQTQGTTQMPVEEVPQGQVPPEDGGPGQTQGQKQKYIFYLQIKPGEAFPVESGDQVQYIHGEYLTCAECRPRAEDRDSPYFQSLLKWALAHFKVQWTEII